MKQNCIKRILRENVWLEYIYHFMKDRFKYKNTFSRSFNRNVGFM